MSGQTIDYKKYHDALIEVGEPVLLDQLDTSFNLQAMLAYARENGKSPADLTDEEKQQFVSFKQKETQMPPRDTSVNS